MAKWIAASRTQLDVLIGHPTRTNCFRRYGNFSETPRGFLQHAQEFWVAADLVISKTQYVSLPVYFHLGRSIELSLKAILLNRGMETERLRSRSFGHDLKALLREACHRGIDEHIRLESIDTGVIQLLSYDYVKKRLEYRVTKGTYYLPVLPQTSAIARRLAYDLEPHLSHRGA